MSDFDSSYPPEDIKEYMNERCTYDSVDILRDHYRPIYVFNNLVLNAGETEKLHLPGEWNVVMEGGMNYGHLIKEAVGSFLYCQKVFPQAKPLFMNAYGRENQSENQDTLHILNYVNSKLLNDFGPESYTMDAHTLNHVEVKIDKFIIMMDNAGLFFSKQKTVFNDVINPHLCKVLIEYFKEFKKDDMSMPKKIFITRKNASKEIREKGLHEHPHYKTRYFEEWVEDPIEQCFIDHGYTVVDVNGMTLQQQISLFHNAEKIGGILGCAFMNTMFIKDGTDIYAVRPNDLHKSEWEEDVRTLFPNSLFKYIDPWDCQSSEEIYKYVNNEIV